MRQAIKDMFAAFGKESENERKVVYITQLQCFPPELVRMACQKAMLESEYMPTLAVLIKDIKSLLSEQRPDLRCKTWAEAWDEIDKAMYKFGCNPNKAGMKFSTPEIEQTVNAIGGIDVIATCEADNLNTLRAHVRKMYEDTCRRSEEREMNNFILGNTATALGKGKRKCSEISA